MARKYYPFFTDEDVLDATEVAPLDDVTAGTGAVSKAVILSSEGKYSIGTTAAPITSSTAASEFFAFRTSCSATSGSSYGARFNHKITGAAGSGAAIRGYGFAYGVEAANVYGGEFTAEIHSSSGSAISGQIAAVRAVLSIQGTGSGTGHAISLVSDTASGKSATAASAFIGISCIGAGAATGIKALLNIPAPVAHDTASLFVSSADKAATHMIRFVDAAGTVYWLLATTNEPA